MRAEPAAGARPSRYTINHSLYFSENQVKYIALPSLSLTMFAMSAAMLAASGVAHAQSSVTLYGVIDESLEYVSNAGGPGAAGAQRRYGLDNSAVGVSLWGLKGKEDLGGGLAALFQLESGFNTTNGSVSGQQPAASLFSRDAFVGLSSERFGTLTFGRQYDAVTDMVQPLTGDMWGASAFATPGDVDNNDDGTVVNNAVKYVSPVFAGLQMEGEYAFGGVAGATGAGQSWSVAATGTTGGLTVAAGYFRASYNQLTGNWSSATAQPLLGGALGYDPASYRSAGIAQAAVQYATGPYTVSVRYSNAQYHGANGAPSVHFNVGAALFQYQATQAWTLGLGYAYVHGSAPAAVQGVDPSATAASIHQISAGAQYALSKRTTLYAVGAYQHASGALASAGDMYYTSSNGAQVIANLGILHRF
ncbi:porin [Paraburkholderia kururiensis]